MPSLYRLAQNLVLIAVLLWLSAATAWAQKIPHSHTAYGSGKIASVELINPTQRYAHFVLGDRFEAAAFRVIFKDGKRDEFSLPPTEVFEDRVPRLVDLTGDGREELIVVQSHVNKGASLAVYDLVADNIRLLAQSPYIGQPNRWLNPAGIADFDGDGHLEIALVAKPHLAKELQLWRFAEGQLSLISTHQGFSNHRLGSREQGLSAQAEVNGDGITDLIVPGPDRKSLHMVSFANGFELLRKIEFAAEIKGPVTLKGRQLSVPLRSGKTEMLQIY